MITTQLTLKDRITLFIATWLVKFGKLNHDDFTQAELQTLIEDAFPYQFTFDIPVGVGTVNVLEGKVTLDNTANRVGLQCLAAVQIEVAASTIYRAHIVFALSATPHYDPNAETLYLTNLTTDTLTLINDDYAFIRDTQFLLSKFFPKGINSLLGKPLRSALSLFTAGTSDKASEYLKLYLSGSKQAILDYHKPQIDNAVTRQLTQDDLSHRMRDTQWREVLFARMGKNVRVEDNMLRFYLNDHSQ
jgi:hypothetical protein